MLKIAVCAKQVPDTDIPPSQFKVDEAGLRVIPPAGVPPIVNGFDMNAVEAALRLRDAGGDVEIVIFSVGTWVCVGCDEEAAGDWCGSVSFGG